MSPFRTSSLPWRCLTAALVLTGLASCGGVGSGGSGMTAGGVTDGTVNGFGSVIVDGTRYDDRSASVVSEVAPGSDVISQVKLGHRVSVQFEADGVAHAVRVDAALAGPVASVDSPNQQFAMLGQTVRVNINGAAGPITQFGGGYRQLSDVQAGDPVSVHGLLVRQATAYSFQATRIDRLASAPAYLRASGVVTNLGSTFTLGALAVDASQATLLPADTTLANGQTVTLLALPTSLQSPTPSTWQLTAAQVRVQAVRDPTLERRVSGSVSQLNVQARTFNLAGFTVSYGSASVSPIGTALADGLYAVVRATAAADGTLVATSVTVRDAGSDSEAELLGNITAYNAGSSQFVVRGVAIDASTALLEGCPASGLANGLFVQVDGRVSATGVVAKSVHCEDEPSGATVEREGVASAVNPVAKIFTLTTSGGSISVQWSDITYFQGVTTSTLPGARVEAEGNFVNGVLVATKIERED